MLGGLALAPSAADAVTAPRAYTRAEWSARPPRSAVSVIGKPDHIVIHHTASQNTADFSLAAAFAEHEGIYVTASVPSPLFETSVQTCAWLCSTYGLDPHVAIVGHRDYNSTQCPGDVLHARLPELRDRVAVVLAS